MHLGKRTQYAASYLDRDRRFYSPPPKKAATSKRPGEKRFYPKTTNSPALGARDSRIQAEEPARANSGRPDRDRDAGRSGEGWRKERKEDREQKQRDRSHGDPKDKKRR